MSLRVPVILFKTPANTFPSDPYTQLLEEHGYEPSFVPVLNESFRLDELEAIIVGGEDEYEGVVIMSRRGADAWVRAARRAGHGSGKYQAANCNSIDVSAKSVKQGKPSSTAHLMLNADSEQDCSLGELYRSLQLEPPLERASFKPIFCAFSDLTLLILRTPVNPRPPLSLSSSERHLERVDTKPT